MAKQHTPHDKFFCAIMSDLRIVKDFLRMYLPQELFVQLDLDTVEVLPRKFIDEHLNCLEVDVVVKVNYVNFAMPLYVLMEHQRNPVRLMLLRMDEYRNQIRKWHCQHYHTEQIPLVYGIVYYNGKRPYPYAKSINETQLEVTNVKAYLDDWVMMADLHDMTQQQDHHGHWANLVNNVMSYPIHNDDHQFFKHLAEKLFILENFDDSGTIFTNVMSYYLSVSNRSDIDAIDRLAKSYLPPLLKEKAMSLADRLIAHGRDEGIQIGLEQGVQQGLEQGVQQGMTKGSEKATLAIARKLLREKTELKIIARVTGLSLAQLKQLVVN